MGRLRQTGCRQKQAKAQRVTPARQQLLPNCKGLKHRLPKNASRYSLLWARFCRTNSPQVSENTLDLPSWPEQSSLAVNSNRPGTGLDSVAADSGRCEL